MKVVEYNHEHLDILISFIQHVWDTDVTAQKFLEKRDRDQITNPYAGAVGFPIFLLVENDRVVGHMAATPCKLWANNQQCEMFWISGLHLLDECRGKGVARLLPMKAIEKLNIITGFFVLDAPLRIYKKLGFHIVGKIPEYVKILNPTSFVRNIRVEKIKSLPLIFQKAFQSSNSIIKNCRESIFSVMMKFYNCIGYFHKSANDKKYTFRIVGSFDERIDDLWERNSLFIKYAQVRNAEYLNWRFNNEDGWIKLILEDSGKVLAYSILSMKKFNNDERLGNMNLLSIIDMLWDFHRPDVLHAMIEYIEMFANIKGSDAVICSISDKRARNILLKNRFIRISGTVYFEYHLRDKSMKFSDEMDNWYITRGDADAAGNLGPM